MALKLTQRRFGRNVWSVVVLGPLLAIGCSSSPTSPSPPVTNPPPVPGPSLSIACPPSSTVISATPVAVSFPAPVTAGGVAPVQVACARQSGSAFPLGTTPVQCTATDATTTSTACTFSVTVNVPVPRVSRLRYLAFGDSFTAGELAPGSPGTAREYEERSFTFNVVPAISYPTQLHTMLRARYTDQAASIAVTNSGLPGEWAEDGAVRMPGVLSNLRPEVVLLLEGINELSALGQPGLARAIAGIDKMAKESRNRGARLFLATVPPSRPGMPRSVPPQLVASLNDRIRITANGEGAFLVDIHGAISVDVLRYVGTDGIHLTEAGYLRVAQVFMEAIQKDLEVR